MRRNEPVTQLEYVVPPGSSLVSTTDLKGRITYCNPAFIEVSGFTRDELLGQPHNLIRHPDMPSEAFRDLWQTVSSGRPWSALVKNRRKNGDHYWVQANVTPLLEDGRPVGYMSVRSVPDRADVDRAQALYGRLNAGDSGLRLQHGQVRRSGLPGWIDTAWARARARAVPIGAVALAGSAWAIGAYVGASVFLLAGTATLGAVAGLVAARRHERPLATLLDVSRRMAAGDLRQRVPRDAGGVLGELQGALAQLNVNLQAIVGDARSEVERMEGSIGEIAQGSLDMSSRTESQASNLQQTAASMEEITGTVRQGTDTARQASSLADGAADASRKGSDAMQRVSATMGEIRDASQRIAEISGVIDGISFQTNLLALNAAVEAARVGEQGRGFGVVAAEVRALAGRSAEAAREIRRLIEDAQSRIELGVTEAGTATTTIRETAERVNKVTHLIHEMSHGSTEQLTGISQVNQAVAHLDGITQQNAAMVEQLSAAASALRGQAQVMSDSVRVFQTGRNDRAASASREGAIG